MIPFLLLAPLLAGCADASITIAVTVNDPQGAWTMEVRQEGRTVAEHDLQAGARSYRIDLDAELFEVFVLRDGAEVATAFGDAGDPDCPPDISVAVTGRQGSVSIGCA